MSDVTIVDNFLHKIAQQQFEKFIIHNDAIEWRYLHNSIFSSDVNELHFCQYDPDIVVKKFGNFTHPLISNDVNVSDINNSIPDFKKTIENKFKVRIKKILASRIQFSIPTGEVSSKYNVPHYDLACPAGVSKYKSIIYYINDTDGDTVLFDEMGYVDTPALLDVNKKTLIHRISPKKGTAIMFDSNRYHAGSFPSTNIRLIVSIILELEDE